MEDQIKCPKCGSTQIAANKKGFSAGKAVAGAVLTGGIGLAAGAIGSNKIIITCLNCGHGWNPVREAQKKRDVVRRESYKNAIASKERWKAQRLEFYKMYEEGKLDDAYLYIKKARPNWKYQNATEVYEAMKKSDTANVRTVFILITVIILVVALIVWANA